MNLQTTPPETAPSLQPPLSDLEQSALHDCESLIYKHLHSFVQVGLALAQIQRQRLYRAEYSSFQEYCRARWDFGRVHAHRMVKGAELVETLHADLADLPLPETERQVRPLTRLAPALAKEAWTIAVSQADGRSITARLVADAARDLTNTFQDSPRPRRSRETWQRQIIPLLQDALVQAKGGVRSGVEQLLFKAQLQLELGADRTE